MHENFIPHSGFITAIDDPMALGRVKVHCESIDGTNPAQETIWVNVLKGPEGLGSDSPSPPQIGTRVIVLVNRTNPSIRQVSNIIGSQKQKENPEMPGNASLAFMRKAWEDKKNAAISGPAKMKQEPEVNGRGSTVEKAPVAQVEETSELSITERKELPTQISANPQMITETPTVKNVSTALTPDSSIFTSSMAAQLPGSPFGLGNIFDFIQGDLLDELETALPGEIMTALRNISTSSSTFTPSNVNGFLQNANFVNPATIGLNMVNELKNVKNIKDLRRALTKIMTDDSIKDLGSLASVDIIGASGFGSIPMKLNANGDIEVLPSDLLDLAKLLFGTLTSGIHSLGGSKTFLDNSRIPNTLLERMLPEKAIIFKEMFEKLSGTNNPARVLVETKLSQLKIKLEG